VPKPVFVGTAGWSIPREWAARFAGEGSHLERYARVLPAAENNSSFYRISERATYARWAVSVPRDFRMSVKMPRAISHYARLKGTRPVLERFLRHVRGLGRTLGCLLLQLPASFPYERRRAAAFLTLLRRRHRGAVVLEPRHPSWFDPQVDALLKKMRVARVAADPPPVAGALEPGGWSRLVYFRLHGSPQMYYSAYSSDFLAALADRLHGASRRATVWCIFDNTASGAALGNALELIGQLRARIPNSLHGGGP
jgi:uncharacterized protein YecE (DUF72 family)